MTLCSQDLLAQIESATPAELRSTFARLVQDERAEALQLLDLLLDDDSVLARRMPVIETLVTALSTDESDGKRRVVRDPAALTERLAQLAAQAASGPMSELSDAARQLTLAASNDAEGEMLQQVVYAIRALKTSLGSRLLAPKVLKATVTYNAALWHRLDDVHAAEVAAPDSHMTSEGAIAVASSQAPAVAPGATPECDGAVPDSARAWPPTRTYARPEVTHAETPGEPSYRRWIRPVAGFAIVCATAVGLFVTQDRGTFFTYSDAQLRGLSPMLVSAYRDQQGRGPLFVGRLAESWIDLDPARRERTCHEIVEQLRKQGVQKVMIYSANFRLEAQYTDGQLRSFETARR